MLKKITFLSVLVAAAWLVLGQVHAQGATDEQKAILQNLQLIKKLDNTVSLTVTSVLQGSNPLFAIQGLSDAKDIAKTIDLSGCPDDFKQVATKYIKAIEDGFGEINPAVNAIQELHASESDPNKMASAIGRIQEQMKPKFTQVISNLKLRKKEMLEVAALHGVDFAGLQAMPAVMQSATPQRTWQEEEANQRAMMELLSKPISEKEEDCIDLCLELAGCLELAKKWLDGGQIDRRHRFGEHADAFQVALDSAKMAFNGKLYKHAVMKYVSAANNVNWIYVHLPMRELAERDLKALADNAVKLGGKDKAPRLEEQVKSIEAAIRHVTHLLDEGEIEDALKEITDAQALVDKIQAAGLEVAAAEKAPAGEKAPAEQKPYMVVDLRSGKVRYSDAGPDLSSNGCRTSEIWMRLIPAATFMMGSPESELGRTKEEMQHQVTLTQGYYIGIFEVTQMQYELITDGNPSSCQGETRPVEQVSYDDIRGSGPNTAWPAAGHAVADGSFLGKLRTKTGLEFDLPTEAQWEYACRAGITTALNSGKNLTGINRCPNMADVGRYWVNRTDGVGGYGEHTKVGSYQPNAWGLYYMHGNVVEWCLDWSGNYPSEAVSDPQGVESGSYRVLRGGSWNSSAQRCRSAYRNYVSPSIRRYYIGFRLVCPL